MTESRPSVGADVVPKTLQSVSAEVADGVSEDEDPFSVYAAYELVGESRPRFGNS